MYYIGNVVKSVAGIYNNLNSATLTGAIDIIVVKDEDGSYMGSPFHVRFGKLGVVNSREKVVEIAVNDKEVDLQMKLGTAGEAFFVEQASVKEKIPMNLCTSPIPDPMEHFKKSFLYEGNELSPTSSSVKIDIGDNGDEGNDGDDDDDLKNLKPANSLAIPIPGLPEVPGVPGVPGSRGHLREKRKKGKEIMGDEDDDGDGDDDDDVELSGSPRKSQSINIPGKKWHIEDVDEDDELDLSLSHLGSVTRTPYPLSDMDSPISTPLSSSPMSGPIRHVMSDTEIEEPCQESLIRSNNIKWEWGMLPEGTPSRSKPRENPRQRRKSKTRKEIVEQFMPETEGLLLDEVLAADKEVADMYLNRANSFDKFEAFQFDQDSPRSTRQQRHSSQNSDSPIPSPPDDHVVNVDQQVDISAPFEGDQDTPPSGELSSEATTSSNNYSLPANSSLPLVEPNNEQ